MTQFFPPNLPHQSGKYYRRGYKIQKSFYRITTKALVMNPDQKLWLIREGRFRDPKSGVYREDPACFDMVGGGMNWGDGFREGLMREIQEELGARERVDYTLSDKPLIIQVTELDDRYHGDIEKDDFYPVCMFYFAVKFHHFTFPDAPDHLEQLWIPLDAFEHTPIWSHVKSLASVFDPASFPREYHSLPSVYE